MRKDQAKAIESIPRGFYRLTDADALRPDDLVWSWPSGEFFRADSPEWLRSPLLDKVEDLICAVRKVKLSEFEASVPKQRSFKFKL